MGTRRLAAEGPRKGRTGSEGPPGIPTHAVPAGLPERLELEKKRSRQSLEDLEQLRAKEVLVSYTIRPPVPTVRPGWQAVPNAHPWLCSP